MLENHVYPTPWLQVVLPAVLALLGVLLGAILGRRDKNLESLPKNARFLMGQLLACTSATAVVILLAVFLFFNPYSPVEAPMAALGRMFPLVLSAALAGAGGFVGRRSLLVSAFALGFFPWWIGLYLLLTPGIFKWIPIAQFGYLAAAWLIARGRTQPA